MTKTKAPKFSWQMAAETLARKFPRERLHPAVAAFAAERSPNEKWCAGFSGGADSLALLLLLWAHWPRRRTRLAALHFNHRLRGLESNRDEKFCREVAAALRVKFISGAWKTARKGASEAEARAERQAFFETHARVLWLGHQQDDIAETMLMRLARGSGTGGLAAPRPVQPLPHERVHVRPLLTLKKKEIVAALNAAGATWREDSSNARDTHYRNRVRHRVLPAWSIAAQRDALAGAAHARSLLEEDDTALEAWVAELRPFAKNGSLLLAKFSRKPAALLRRALHRWLQFQPAAGKLARQGFEALLAAAVEGKSTRQSLGREGFAVIRNGRLRFEKSGKSPREFQRRTN
jgi:tRNA(Ile)-lysidine synthase